MTNAQKTHESAKTRKRTTKNAQTHKTHPITPNHTKKKTHKITQNHKRHTKNIQKHKKHDKSQKTQKNAQNIKKQLDAHLLLNY